MYRRKKIVSYLDGFLETSEIYDPFYDNSLVLEGKDKIKKVLIALSPTKEVINLAVKNNYDLLITHYGLFYREAPLRITRYLKKKLNMIIESDMNHYVIHLPLDLHEEIGSSMQIIRGLEGELMGSFGKDDVEMAFTGHVPKGIKFPLMIDRLKNNISDRVIGINFGTKKVYNFAVTTNNFKDVIYDALDYDALITTYIEPTLYNEAKEYGLNLVYINEYDVKRISLSLLKYKLLTVFPLLHLDVANEFEEQKKFQIFNFRQ